MKVTTTSERLKQIMRKRDLKQVDILKLCQPYCERYNVKLAKNDLSQYVSGKVTPGQDKLSILGMALNVSETWLMGYDLPKQTKKSLPQIEGDSNENVIITRGRDGSYTRRKVTDEQLQAIQLIIDQLPDADF